MCYLWGSSSPPTAIITNCKCARRTYPLAHATGCGSCSFSHPFRYLCALYPVCVWTAWGWRESDTSHSSLPEGKTFSSCTQTSHHAVHFHSCTGNSMYGCVCQVLCSFCFKVVALLAILFFLPSPTVCCWHICRWLQNGALTKATFTLRFAK